MSQETSRRIHSFPRRRLTLFPSQKTRRVKIKLRVASKEDGVKKMTVFFVVKSAR